MLPDVSVCKVCRLSMSSSAKCVNGMRAVLPNVSMVY